MEIKALLKLLVITLLLCPPFAFPFEICNSEIKISNEFAPLQEIESSTNESIEKYKSWFPQSKAFKSLGNNNYLLIGWVDLGKSDFQGMNKDLFSEIVQRGNENLIKQMDMIAFKIEKNVSFESLSSQSFLGLQNRSREKMAVIKSVLFAPALLCRIDVFWIGKSQDFDFLKGMSLSFLDQLRGQIPPPANQDQILGEGDESEGIPFDWKGVLIVGFLGGLLGALINKFIFKKGE